MRIRFLFLPFLILLVNVISGPVFAQKSPVFSTPAATSSNSSVSPTSQNLQELVSVLQDPIARQKLIDQLNTLIQAQQQTDKTNKSFFGTQLNDLFSQRINQLSQRLASLGDLLKNFPQAVHWLQNKLSSSNIRKEWLRLVIEVGFVLLAGFAAYHLCTYLLRDTRRSLSQRPVDSYIARLPTLLARTLLDLVPILAFALITFLLLIPLPFPSTIRIPVVSLINATILAHIIIVTGRFLLSPNTPNLRLLPLSNETANYFYIWISRLTYFMVFSYFLLQSLQLIGLPLVTYDALLKIDGLFITILLIVLILQNQPSISAWLRTDPSNSRTSQITALPGNLFYLHRTRSLFSSSSIGRLLRHHLADVWHILLIAYVAATYFIWALEIDGGFSFIIRGTVVTVLILIITWLLVKGAHSLIHRGFTITPETLAQHPNLERRANLYLPFLKKTTQFTLWLIAFLIILNTWGLDSLSWIKTPFGRHVLSGTASIVVIITIAVGIWELVNQSIERYLAGSFSNGERIERSARIRTLLPLLRNAFLITLITIVTLVVLSEIGMKIAPLLAGAGVIGIAIGFGSQTLVKDVITGLFYLFEDTISIGDVVTISDNHSGVVEGLSIRTLKLRDGDGAVHTIPFSEVNSVINMTKDFAYASFDINVSYQEDIEKVMQVLQQIGQEFQKTTALGKGILSPLEIQGLDAFKDFAIVIKARFKTRAGKQWDVARAFNLYLKKKLDETGIHMPFGQRGSILISPSKTLSSEKEKDLS